MLRAGRRGGDLFMFALLWCVLVVGCSTGWHGHSAALCVVVQCGNVVVYPDRFLLTAAACEAGTYTVSVTNGNSHCCVIKQPQLQHNTAPFAAVYTQPLARGRSGERKGCDKQQQRQLARWCPASHRLQHRWHQGDVCSWHGVIV